MASETRVTCDRCGGDAGRFQVRIWDNGEPSSDREDAHDICTTCFAYFQSWWAGQDWSAVVASQPLDEA